MWKLLKSLPKTWRQKICSPLGSNSCPDESAESESCANGVIPDLVACNAFPNETASSLTINDQKNDNNVSVAGNANPPNRCLYRWMFNKPLQPAQNECPVKSFIEAFCVGVNSLLEKRRGLSVSCGKLNDHQFKEKHLRLSASLVQIAFAKRSLGVSHSVLPNYRVNAIASSASELSSFHTQQSSSISDQSENSKSLLSSSTSKQSQNDEILNQLEEIAAEYTSQVLNNEAKQLVKQKDYGQALEMFNYASGLGCTEAKYNLGVCYESGIGMEPDINKALQYFNEAASKGHSGALYNLAVFHLEGRGVPVNETKGIEYMEKASEGGIKEAHTYLGVHCGQHGEYIKALQFFQKAVNQNDPEGEYYLGLCYDHGMGIEENVKNAIELYKKASAGGNAEACYILGTYYDEGLRGVAKDKSSALEFYQKAATTGHPLAIERLKWSSEGDDEDDVIAFEDDVSNCPLLKTPESTLRTTKSSPDLSSQYSKASSTHATELPNSLTLFDFSSLKQLIQLWSHGISVPEKSSKLNEDHGYSFKNNSGLSQSLTKLSVQ